MKKYIILAAVTLICYFVHSFFQFSGGIGADSLSYFGIAADLPNPETALFPLGFPVLLRLFYEIFGDYFWASKALNMVLLLIILMFSYLKKFYFRETVILLTGKTVFFIFTVVMSENLFLFLCYFLIYCIHERIHNRFKGVPFIIWTSLITVLLFTVRYSGIYIYASLGLFWLLAVWKIRDRSYTKDLFKVLVLSGIGIAAYLFWNYIHFGSFTGEDLRGKPAQYYAVYILRDFLGMINVVNPFIGIKPASNSVFSIAFQVGLAVFDIVLAFLLFRIFQRKKHLLRLDFHYFMWLTAILYTLALFLSGLFQQIEEMNMRTLAAANFILFFSFLIVYYADLKNDQLIFTISCFFLFFQMAYSLKSPGSYLEVREQIEPQMPQYSRKKYLFNDEQNHLIISTYKIPVINREIKYPHTANQTGYVKQSVAGGLNPKIKWLKYDTIQDKSQVLYTSQLKLK